MNDTELDQLLDAWQAPAPSPATRSNLRAAFPQPTRRRLLGVPLRWFAVAAPAAGLMALGTSFKGSLGESNATVELPSGIANVRTRYYVDPAAAMVRWWWRGGHGASTGATPEGEVRGSAHFHDNSTDLYYGYEYVATPLGSGRYRVTFSALRQSTISRGPFEVTGKPAALPMIPAPRIMADGEAIDIEAYRGSMERLVIRLQISTKALPDAAPPAPQPLHTLNSTVYKNGALVASLEGDAAGASIWFRLPGEGRYLITLDATGNAAFAAAGQVNGNVLEFQSGNDTYRLESVTPLIAGPPRTFYVFHDAAFESQLKPGNQAPMVGSAGPACVINSSCVPH